MEPLNIPLRRLHNQQLEQSHFQTPEEVVAWLGAVQSQDYAGAKWSLGMRLPDATDAAIDRAFADGAILRTHVMRPTWHFVTPADIRWLLDLTAPRVNAANAHRYRQLELDDALLARSDEVIAKALEGSHPLTRAELAEALERAGINTEGQRLAHIVMHAELSAVVCSGPRRGKQFTYAPLEQRAPGAKRLARDEALAELVRRYFTSHGPATVQDFVWWSGLTQADAKIGLDLCGSLLISEAVGGRTYWYSSSSPAVEGPSRRAYLLPAFDEYTVAYRDDSPILDPAYAEQAKNVVFAGTIAINGQIAGHWRRTFSKGAVVIEIAPFRPFTADEEQAVAAAVRRFGAFLGMDAVMG